MSKLYLEHFQLNRPPFDQEPDPRIFFPAAGRITVLQNLLADIENGKPLVNLIGTEGTGKTLFCRLLEQSLSPERYQVVSVEHPIGSYDNLLRTLCLALGTMEDVGDDDEAPPDYPALFTGHLHRIESEGRVLVLLVDEAENLFLATLERLIRLICDTEESRNLRILLVGRPELGAHLDQLAVYCSSVDINAGYTLEALSFDETMEYIRFRLKEAGMPGDKYLDLFSDDAIDMIFQAAMGNISLTNSLAEQGLKKACGHGMFQVDDESIQPQQSLEENVSLALFQGFDFLKENRWWLLAGIFVVWVVLMLLWPADEQQKVEDAGGEDLGISRPEQEIIVPPVPDVPEIIEPPPVVQEKEESGGQQLVESERRILVEREMSEPEEETLPETLPEVLPEEAEVEPQKLVHPDEQVQPPVKKKPQEKLPEKKTVVIEADRKKKAVPVEPVPVPRNEHPSMNADMLFKERVRASSAWLAWAYRGGYTVQLMVLASETAEDNLKKILIDDRYFAIKDQLFILRKISPQTIFVFYGNYPNMEKAREARNSMPPFLKENQPYALSIQDAMKKIEE